MENLLKEIKACTICKDFLPNAPNPIIRASKCPVSKILENRIVINTNS
jgi:hypothetical protein